MPDPLLLDYSRYPRMAHWFSPLLLLKLLNNVILSSIFGHYADRRLIIAALDTVSPETHLQRATALKAKLQPDAEGAVWIDWVADLGDGFDSTYAVASLLARKELSLGERLLPRGQALFMGEMKFIPPQARRRIRTSYASPTLGHSPIMIINQRTAFLSLRFPAITIGMTGSCSFSPTSAERKNGISEIGAVSSARPILRFN